MKLGRPQDRGLVARLRAAGCVFAEDEAALLTAAPGPLEPLVARRAAGEPLEHVLGWVEFAGLRLTIEPGVFIPRRRTEFLVELAASLAPPTPVVLDLCCGNGALGAAFRARVPGADVHAADIDRLAVECATKNLGANVYESDLFTAVPKQLRFDVVLVNVPYVPSAEIGTMPVEAREYEPVLALDGGADGLDVLRRVAAAAPERLAPQGILLTECSEQQATTAAAVLAGAGLSPSVRRHDERNATVVLGRNGSGSC